jgi:hypothetical protein
VKSPPLGAAPRPAAEALAGSLLELPPEEPPLALALAPLPLCPGDGMKLIPEPLPLPFDSEPGGIVALPLSGVLPALAAVPELPVSVLDPVEPPDDALAVGSGAVVGVGVAVGVGVGVAVAVAVGAGVVGVPVAVGAGAEVVGSELGVGAAAAGAGVAVAAVLPDEPLSGTIGVPPPLMLFGP